MLFGRIQVNIFHLLFGVFHECQVQGFFEILKLKFTFVNEHFKISKVTKKLALVKNAEVFYKKIIKDINFYINICSSAYFSFLVILAFLLLKAKTDAILAPRPLNTAISACFLVSPLNLPPAGIFIFNS